MIIYIRIYWTVVLLIICYSNICAQQQIPVEDAHYPVSIIKLFANIDFYHNKKVRVEGFLHYKFEDSSLFFSKTDSEYLILSNALWIRYNLKKSIDLNSYNQKYVSIIGIFNKDDFGHMGRFAGTINNVEIIYLLEKRTKKSKK